MQPDELEVITLMNLEQRKELVEALLACPSMSNQDSRQTVVDDLPDQIKVNVKRHETARLHLTSIIKTCLNYPDGIKRLIEIVRYYEGESLPMQKVDEVLSHQAQSPEGAHQAQQLSQNKTNVPIQSALSMIPASRGALPPPSGYESPFRPEDAYQFENREEDLRKIGAYLESEPYLHLYGPSGIGKTYLAGELRQERYTEHPSAYLDFNEAKFRAMGRSVLDLLREIHRQFYNTTPSSALKLTEQITNLASKARETSRYGLVILDNLDRMAPSVRRQLREETLPKLQERIADPKLTLRIIAIAQTEMQELSGLGPVRFRLYPLSEFQGILDDLKTYKGLLRQAVARWGNQQFDPHDAKADNLLKGWADELYDLTSGHPGAIEGTLNYVGRQTQFAWKGVFEEQREGICQHVLAPLLEQQVQAFLPLSEHQQALRLLWIFRYLSRRVFRQLLREAQGRTHWRELNDLVGKIDNGDRYMPTWARLIETQLLQYQGISSRRSLSHQLTPIWRQLGNLILQVTNPPLYQALHGDARAVFEHFAFDKSAIDTSRRIDCFVEALYHLTQEASIPTAAHSRIDLTEEMPKRLDDLLLLLKDHEYLYKLYDLLANDQELEAELERVGQAATRQQLISTIKRLLR